MHPQAFVTSRCLPLTPTCEAVSAGTTWGWKAVGSEPPLLAEAAPGDGASGTGHRLSIRFCGPGFRWRPARSGL